jgi:hypothetical protein
MARTGINYGNSGSYKSTSVKHFSHYIYEVTGKKTLLVSMDGGGWAPMNPEIAAGIIVPYRVSTTLPLPILRKLSQGYFPKDPTESDFRKVNLCQVNWQEFGGYAVEGLTSISQSIMRYLADANVKTGQEATNPFSLRVMVEGEIVTETFAGNSMAHYGFVQNALYSLVTNFSALPCHYVLFTALESRTEEEDRSSVYGPQIAGKKATNLVPSWVGDCLHSEAYPVEKVIEVADPQNASKKISQTIVETLVRTYFVKHPDPSTGIMFPAKPRVTPEKVAELMKKWPGGYYEPGPEHGLDTYLHEIDRLDLSQGDELAKWRAEVDRRRQQQQAGPATAAPQPGTPK